MTNRLHWSWRHANAADRFKTGVSLHGHTMHSEECLSFLPRYLHQVPGISSIVTRYERARVDFARAWWTPPLSPQAALRLESYQIAGIGLRPMVSLTDHDNIEAGLSLGPKIPVSAEWTVPYHGTILHLGIHNLPRGSEAIWMSEMAEYTAVQDESRLRTLLGELHAASGVLTVLNHPMWLEEGVTQADHDHALPVFLQRYGTWMHAFEFNGTRSWAENAAVLALARAYSRPIISGGDRHGCEPAACINLTNAGSFDEFVSEVRDGESTLLVMPQYREPRTFRIFEAAWDILRPHPEYPGRERWMDRFFYRGDDGVARPLSVVWKEQAPWMLNPASSLLQFVASAPLRPALRLLLGARAEAMP